jgi:hypothetical protein
MEAVVAYESVFGNTRKIADGLVQRSSSPSSSGSPDAGWRIATPAGATTRRRSTRSMRPKRFTGCCRPRARPTARLTRRGTPAVIADFPHSRA